MREPRSRGRSMALKRIATDVHISLNVGPPTGSADWIGRRVCRSNGSQCNNLCAGPQPATLDLSCAPSAVTRAELTGPCMPDVC
jgi:hypothetical protein